MPITERVLENGIRLIAEPIAATKAAAIGFWFSGGSRDEKPGQFGLTHFIEHLLFKGTKNRSAFDISLFFDRIGGYINAFTERENVCVYCVVPGSHANDAVTVICDMLIHSLFNKTDIETERNVIISEILASQDDSEEMAMDAALQSMFCSHGIARPIGGSVLDVENLEDVLISDHYRACFAGVPPVVTVAGAIDIDGVVARLKEISYTNSVLSSCKCDDESPHWYPGQNYLISRFSQTQIFLSYPVHRPKTARDFFAWSILNTIIGDSVSSRLFQNLREKKGLCYSSWSAFSVHRDFSFWTAYLATPPEKSAEAVLSLRSEIGTVKTAGLTVQEIADAKSHLCGEHVLSAEDTENRMKRLARQFFFSGSILTVEESIQVIEQIDADCINQLIAENFNEDLCSFVVYGNRTSIRESKKIWR